MTVGVLPRDPAAVLTAANVAEGQELTRHDVDLGGLMRVAASVIDDEVVIYGEFQVDAATVENLEPVEGPTREAALSGIVEDWGPHTDGEVVLSAYIYVQTHEHGPLGVTLGEALEVLNDIRLRCLTWLEPGPHAGNPQG